MLKDLSNLEKELAQLIADKKQQLSLDCVLPDAFKRLTRRIENNKIVYQQYSFIVSSTIDIYFPNQLWYFAAICVPLYTELKKYADLVKSNLTKKEIIDCKDNRAYAETLINSKSELIAEKDNVIKFLSDYKWWRGGKTIDRGDYYYSPILSICNLVNASQGYVAEMCKYLSTNPEATQILLNVVDNLPESIDDYEIIVESSKVVEFLCLTVKELLMFDENMSMIDFNINTKTIGVSGCNIGKLKDVQDKNDDPRRANDCDTSIVWEHDGKKYYFLKEQTAEGGKAFINAINNFYAPYYKAEFNNNVFILKKRKVQQLNIGLSNNQPRSQECNNGLPHQQIFYGAPGTGKSFGIKRALVNNNVLSYLSAIRTKPFLLLAGISGTGKSRIVKEMAYASCPDEGDLREDKTSPGNYCLVEVKPNWNDSTELLGYETVLDGGNYHLTKFVKFLVKAMQHENVPFFVCLDEMNLAAVEQYFAEFLSILESRKDVDGTIKSEPLIPAAIFNKYDNKLFKELFPSKEKQEKGTGYTIDNNKIAPCSNATYEILREEGLRIPRNLIVVGTVNMDDTTYQFSRKVIDRAMTIEMNEVNLNDMFDIEKPDALSYREDVVDKGWFFAPFAQSNSALQQMNDERELLVEKIKATIGQTDADGTTTPDSLEAILGKTPFRIAYRVVNELILHFYALRMEDKGAEFEELYNKALDNILMMKVLPRIEGNEDLVKEPLAQLATWTEVTYPKANAKIIEMRERLERSHFTSFWP